MAFRGRYPIERERRPRRVAARAAAVFVLVAASVGLTATAAHAEGITWDTPSLTVEYGEFWSAAATFEPGLTTGCANTSYCPNAVTATFTGTSSGTFQTWMTGDGIPTTISGIDSTLGGTTTTPLPVGEYRFTLSHHVMFFDLDETYTTDQPFVLTIVPAPVGTDLRVVNDPVNSQNGVISFALTGTVTQNVVPFPAGTWTVTVKDGDTEVFAQDVAGTGQPFGSAYWPNVSADTDFTATATYQVSDPGLAPSLDIQPGAASFTSPAAASPTPSPTEEPSSTDAGTSPALPIWALILLGLIVVGCVTTSVVLVLRRRAHGTTPDAPIEPKVESDVA